MLALAWAPGITGYSQDALILHILGTVTDPDDGGYIGVQALAELESKGDKEASRILDSLKRNKAWMQRFGPVTHRPIG